MSATNYRPIQPIFSMSSFASNAWKSWRSTPVLQKAAAVAIATVLTKATVDASFTSASDPRDVATIATNCTATEQTKGNNPVERFLFRLLTPVSLSSCVECQGSAAPNNQQPKLTPVGKDFQRMNLPDRASETDDNGFSQHAIFGNLLSPDLIDTYDIYRWTQAPHVLDDDVSLPNDDVVVAIVQFGNRVCGHGGIVHGGILSLMLDDVFGFAYEAVGIPMAFTANLNVNFRAPVLAGTQVRIHVQLQQKVGRKLHWTAQVTSQDGSTLYAEATCLYIIPKPSALS